MGALEQECSGEGFRGSLPPLAESMDERQVNCSIPWLPMFELGATPRQPAAPVGRLDPAEKHERAMRRALPLLARRRAGQSYASMAREFDLTETRIRQLVRYAEKQERE